MKVKYRPVESPVNLDEEEIEEAGAGAMDPVFTDMLLARDCHGLEVSKLYFFTHHSRITVYCLEGGMHRDWNWLVEAPSRMGGMTPKQTAQALADLCVLRFNLKEKGE